VSGGASPEAPPDGEPPRTFHGWQRTACLVSVGLLCLFTALVVVSAALGAFGFH
jgi:hypothetical protein